MIESPSVQVYPVSIAQLASHPSPATTPPSSQYPEAGLITIPSPQISDHVLGVVELPAVHVHLVSTAQLESHPSPFTIFPSSQYPVVGTKTLPSPQISVQVLEVVGLPDVQPQPTSMLHREFQPSPLIKFPSSQRPAELVITIPSPQKSEHILVVVGLPWVHCQFVSTAQFESHPSPGDIFPSSQYPKL